MSTYILTWNPDRWDEWHDFDDAVKKTERGEGYEDSWSIGTNYGIQKGQRVFLLRQSRDRGIIASGRVSVPKYEDDHWNIPGERAKFVKVIFDQILPISAVLPVEALKNLIPDVPWDRIQASNTKIQQDKSAETLEEMWKSHVSALRKNVVFPDQVPYSKTYPEGSVSRVLVNAYERSTDARRDCLDHYGYACQVCDFDFSKVYGDIGASFIHVHHLRELSQLGQSYQVNPIDDLRPVCPNCHAMLHRQVPCMSIADLRSRVEAQTKKSP